MAIASQSTTAMWSSGQPGCQHNPPGHTPSSREIFQPAGTSGCRALAAPARLAEHCKLCSAFKACREQLHPVLQCTTHPSTDRPTDKTKLVVFRQKTKPKYHKNITPMGAPKKVSFVKGVTAFQRQRLEEDFVLLPCIKKSRSLRKVTVKGTAQ